MEIIEEEKLSKKKLMVNLKDFHSLPKLQFHHYVFYILFSLAIHARVGLSSVSEYGGFIPFIYLIFIE